MTNNTNIAKLRKKMLRCTSWQTLCIIVDCHFQLSALFFFFFFCSLAQLVPSVASKHQNIENYTHTWWKKCFGAASVLPHCTVTLYTPATRCVEPVAVWIQLALRMMTSIIISCERVIVNFLDFTRLYSFLFFFCSALSKNLFHILNVVYFFQTFVLHPHSQDLCCEDSWIDLPQNAVRQLFLKGRLQS